MVWAEAEQRQREWRGGGGEGGGFLLGVSDVLIGASNHCNRRRYRGSALRATYDEIFTALCKSVTIGDLVQAKTRYI